MNDINNLRDILSTFEAWGDLGKALAPGSLKFNRYGSHKPSAPTGLSPSSKTELFSFTSAKDITDFLSNPQGPIGVEIRIGDSPIATVWKKKGSEYTVEFLNRDEIGQIVALGGKVTRSAGRSHTGAPRRYATNKYDSGQFRGDVSSLKLSTFLGLCLKYSHKKHEGLQATAIYSDPEIAKKQAARAKSKSGHPYYVGTEFANPSGFEIKWKPQTSCCGADFRYPGWPKRTECDKCGKEATPLKKMVPSFSTSRALEERARRDLYHRLQKFKAEKAPRVDSPEKLLSLFRSKGYIDKIRVGKYAYALDSNNTEISLAALLGKDSWSSGLRRISFKYEWDRKNAEDWGEMRYDMLKKATAGLPPEEAGRKESEFRQEIKNLMPPYAFFVKFGVQAGSIVPVEVIAAYSEYDQERYLRSVPQAESFMKTALGLARSQFEASGWTFKVGDAVRFNLRDIQPSEFGYEDKETIERLENHLGVVMARATATQVGDKDYEYYDVSFGGDELHAVSGYHLTKQPPVIPKRVPESAISSSRTWVEFTVPANVKLAYHLYKGETEHGGFWFEEANLWLDQVFEPEDDNKHIAMFDATRFWCPSVEEMYEDIKRDLEKLHVSNEDIMAVAKKLHEILTSEVAKLSPNPIEDDKI